MDEETMIEDAISDAPEEEITPEQLSDEAIETAPTEEGDGVQTAL